MAPNLDERPVSVSEHHSQLFVHVCGNENGRQSLYIWARNDYAESQRSTSVTWCLGHLEQVDHLRAYVVAPIELSSIGTCLLPAMSLAIKCSCTRSR